MLGSRRILRIFDVFVFSSFSDGRLTARSGEERERHKEDESVGFHCAMDGGDKRGG